MDKDVTYTEARKEAIETAQVEADETNRPVYVTFDPYRYVFGIMYEKPRQGSMNSTQIVKTIRPTI